MMDNKDFDRLLRQKFKRESLQTRPGSWQQLAERLPVVARKQRTFVYYRAAAAVLVLLGLSIGVALLWNTNTETLQSPVTQEDNGVVTAPHALAAVPDSDSRQPAALSHQKDKRNEGTPESRERRQNHQEALWSAARKERETVMPDREEKHLAQQPLAQEQEGGMEDEKQHSVVQNKLETPAQHFNPGLSRYGANEERWRAPAEQHDEVTHAATTSVALGGGMNYGSLNAGYALGVSARHSLGKRLFVEGSVSFLYNNQAPNTSNYFGAPTTPSRPSAYNGAGAESPSMKLISDFYYLQVNPSLGYQISDFMAVSAGADLQQRIASMSQNGTAVFTPNSDPRIIPQLDLGLTGRTEFFISPKIEAGILYRNGLNNLLQPRDVHPYLNRRYIQVQLKYLFFLN